MLQFCWRIQFNRAAAAAVLPKARAHHASAQKAWAARQRSRTGEETLAASHALEHGLKRVDGAASKSVADAEVSGVIDTMGTQIEDLGKRVTSPKASH